MATSLTPHNNEPSSPGLWLVGFVMAGAFTGFASLSLYVMRQESITDGCKLFGFGLALSGCALLCGGLVGFLFGIPRRVQNAASHDSNPNGRRSYIANTNLEQISDWLTKILVGVGLTQLKDIPIFFDNLGVSLVAGFSNPTVDKSFILALIIGYLIHGFVTGYLTTLFFMQKALEDADGKALAEEAIMAISASQESTISLGTDAEGKFNLINNQALLSEDQVRDVIKSYLATKQETLTHLKPLFSTEQVKTWIARSDKSIIYLRDDPRSRPKGFVQWHIQHENGRPLKVVKAADGINVGSIDIGERKGVAYLHSYWSNPDDLKNWIETGG